MRKLLSILLLGAFVLPLALALQALGDTPESRLPACCRSHGKHHCTMTPAQMDALLHGQHVTVLRSHCPLYPAATAPSPHPPSALGSASHRRSERVSLLCPLRPLQLRARLALEGSPHKRGPPSARLS